MRAWRASRGHALSRTSTRPFSYTRAVREHLNIAHLIQQNAPKEHVDVHAWVRSVRKQKRVAFAALNDGSTIENLQAVFSNPSQASELSYGTGVKLTGAWQSSPGGGQNHELHVSNVQILGENDAENNPLQPKFQTAEYLRTIPHLRSRTTANALLIRLRTQVDATLTMFFLDEGFNKVHPPIITSSDCEGAGEVFTVSSNASKASEQRSPPADEAHVEHFFRKEKYLTVSSQLHLEAMAMAVKNVWTLSPTFRAEKSDTPRHLAEFYMLEAEMCFVDDLDQVMDLVERMLRAVAEKLRTTPLGSELLALKRSSTKDEKSDDEHHITAPDLQHRWDGMASENWPRITYHTAIKTLEQAASTGATHFAFPPSYADGLSAEHERYLAATLGQGKPIFVTDYPAAQKPFYMAPSPSVAGGDTVTCFDLLIPDLCELAGGSMREHRSEELLRAMAEKNVAQGKEGGLEWYVDLRRYGSVPHGGFGLGFDRLLGYLAGVGSIRDTVAFPRWVGRCDC